MRVEELRKLKQLKKLIFFRKMHTRISHLLNEFKETHHSIIKKKYTVQNVIIRKMLYIDKIRWCAVWALGKSTRVSHCNFLVICVLDDEDTPLRFTIAGIQNGPCSIIPDLEILENKLAESKPAYFILKPQ